MGIRVRRTIRTAAVLGAAVSVSACGLFGGGDDPSPSSSAPQSSSPASNTATPDGQRQPVAERVAQVPYEDTAGSAFPAASTYLVASVYGIYRDGENAQLQVGLRVAGDAPAGFVGGMTFLLSAPSDLEDQDPSLNESTGMNLLDMKAGKAYLVARDADNKCLCSTNPKFGTGMTTLVSATYAVPAVDVSTMSVYLPTFGLFRDVPITDGAPPATPLPTPEPGQTMPAVLVAQPHSTAPAAKAPVVDISAETANIDLSVREEKGKVTLAADVLFAFDKATLTGKARSRIAEAAAILRKNASGPVEVRGYTDSKGSDSYNLSLSKRRADAVRKELGPLLSGTGITLTAKGYGEKDPVAANTVKGSDNPEGRALNRRVEIVYRR
ncbi:MAG: OmpA family protein [Streptosporangiales bacterium]|nr:OmpA family protein [Streptosporangiales bacterium]